MTKKTTQRRAAALCLVTMVAAVLVNAAAPAWLDDAANSKWLLFEPAETMESNGVSLRDKGSNEGNITPVTLAGVMGVRSVRPDGSPGYFYLLAEPWETFSAWLGGNDVLLAVRYYDAAPGTMVISYDSSDPRVKRAHYPDGTWRIPRHLPTRREVGGQQGLEDFHCTPAVRLFHQAAARRGHPASPALRPASRWPGWRFPA